MRTVAHIVSWVFLPLFMPMYALLAAMYIPSMDGTFFQVETIFAMHPVNKMIILSQFLIFSVLAPGFSLLLLKRSQRISSLEVDIREERGAPVTITAIYCLVLGVLLQMVGPKGAWPDAIYALPWGGFVAIVLAGWINRYEKISLHALGAGMVFGFFVAYFQTQVLFEFSLLLLSVLIGGLILAARIYLEKHTLRESLSGYVLGFLVVFAAVRYFPHIGEPGIPF